MAEDEKKETKKAPAKKPTAAKKTKEPAKTASAVKSETKGSKPESEGKAASVKKAAATKKVPSGKTVTITQTGSAVGRQAYQRQTLIGLGLNKMHKTRTLEDTPAVRGMINKVKHLLKIEEAA